MRRQFILATLIFAGAVALAGTEIATGKMRGKGYNPPAFYIRDAPSKQWVKTYTGPQYDAQASGRLMNLRIGQAVVHDEWLTEAAFDPEAHTGRVIAGLDTYKQHGILAVNVSLQRANPEYRLMIFPFKHVAPAANSMPRDDMPVEERDPAYLKAVLEHIAGKVFAKKNMP